MKSLFCLKHKNSEIFALLKEKEQTTFRYDECAVQYKPTIELNQVIFLEKTLKEPIYLFFEINKPREQFQYSNIIETRFFSNLIQSFTQQLNQVKHLFDQYVQKIEKEIDNLQEEQNNFPQYQEYRKLFDNFVKFNHNVNVSRKSSFIILKNGKLRIKKLIIQINLVVLQRYLLKIKIRKYINEKEISTFVKEFKKNQKDLQKEIALHFKQNFSNKMELMNLETQNIFTQAYYYPYLANFKSSIAFQGLSLKIINQKFNVIYDSKVDGLNSTSFWNKIQGKSNLLMMFRNSYNLFGGFSTCVWNQSNNPQKSFIFSEKHKQIYQLKPDFGSETISYSSGCIYYGCDFHICANFQAGSSYLGARYACKHAQGSSQSTYIFGQNTPNIIECQVLQFQ